MPSKSGDSEILVPHEPAEVPLFGSEEPGDEASQDEQVFEGTEEEGAEENSSGEEDDLFKSDEDEEEVEEDEEDEEAVEVPKAVSKRIETLSRQRREEREARTVAEMKLAAIEAGNSAVNRLYGKYPNLEQAITHDFNVVEALNALADNPQIAEANKLLNQYLKTGEIPAGTTAKAPAPKVEKPQRDPVVERIVHERVANDLVDILSKSGVQESLYGVITDHISSNVDIYNTTPDELKSAVKGFFRTQGWSREFVTGKSKPQKALVPSGRGTASVRSSKAQSDKQQQDNSDGPKSYAEALEAKDEKFRRLFAETNSQ